MTKRVAQALLSKIDTPEKAVALTGKEREQYLKALDQVYGPKVARQTKLGFGSGDVEYHGTRFTEKPIDQFIPSGSRPGDVYKYGKGVYTTPWPGYASQYADESGAIYPVMLKYKNNLNPADVEQAQQILKAAGIDSSLPKTRLRSTEEGLHLLEQKLGKDKVSQFLDARNFRISLPDDGISVSQPKDIRSINAAFDPRFKDSPYIMAGVAPGAGMAMQGSLGPLREGLAQVGQLGQAYQQNVVQPIAEAAKRRLTPEFVRGNQVVQTASPVSDFIIDMAADPVNYVSGGAGAALGAAQLAAEMAPQKKNKGGMVYKINPDLVAKLYKGGKISERVAKLHGYAEGGVVEPMMTPNPQMQPVPMPQVAPQSPQQEQPSFLSRVGQGLAELTGFAPDPILTRAQNLAERTMQERTALQQPQQGPQLASVAAEGTPPLETFEQPQMGMPQAQMIQIPQVGGMSTETAINRAMQAGAEEGVRAAAAMEGMQAVAKEAQAQEEEQLRIAQEDMAAKQAEINELAKQYQAFSPDRAAAAKKIWDDKTTGQKVLAGIGLIFGAMSPDGVNRAAQMMTKAIEQDVDNQFKRQEMLGRLVTEKRGLLADAQRIYGDQRQARLAVKKLGLDQLQLEIDKYAAKTKNQTQLANLAIARDQVNNERVKLQGELMKASGQSQELFVPGLGFARTKKDRDTLVDLNSDLKSSKIAIDELLKLDRKINPFSTDKATAETLSRALKGNLRTFIVGPGAVTEADQKILDDAVANPTDLFQVNAKERLGALRKALDNKFRAAAEARGMIAPQVQVGQRAR